MIKYNSNTINEWNFGSSNVTKVYRNGVVRYEKIVPNYEFMPFTTVARTNGTINLLIGSGLTVADYEYIKYSTDNGNTWTKVDNVNSQAVSISISVNAGDRVQWKGKGIRMATNTSVFTRFVGSTAQFDIEGYIMSLLNEDEYIGTQMTANYTFYQLFNGCKTLINARYLILPTNTTNGCYRTTFLNCSNLLTAPKLPATTLGINCYYQMFKDCTSLTTAPQLPATTLAAQCYTDMFRGCSSLTAAPELPATALANGCYQNMFNGCTSLTTAPELPATTLANTCYYQMFRGCRSLNSITCLATNISATNCTYNWVSGVAASGTFTKAANMTSWSTGSSGIPSGWTVVNSSRLPSGYTEVEYVENTTAIPNTSSTSRLAVTFADSIPSSISGYTFKLTFEVTDSSNKYNNLFGNGYLIMQYVASSHNFMTTIYSNRRTDSPTNSVLKNIKYEGKLYLNEGDTYPKFDITNVSQGTTVTTNLTTSVSTQINGVKLGLFNGYNNNDTGARTGKAKIYEVIVTDGEGNELCHSVPCTRDIDGKVGFYNLVRNEFDYDGSGELTLIAGPIV